MLPEFSEGLVTCERFTNGQLRSTYVKCQKEAGLEDRLIATVTQHRNLDTLRNYDTDISDDRQRAMSENVANLGEGPRFYNQDNRANIDQIIEAVTTTVGNLIPQQIYNFSAPTASATAKVKSLIFFCLFFLFFFFL